VEHGIAWTALESAPTHLDPHYCCHGVNVPLIVSLLTDNGARYRRFAINSWI
jgi:hypothetical protein